MNPNTSLTTEQVRKIHADLGRQPTDTELLVYSQMWAANCKAPSSLFVEIGFRTVLFVVQGNTYEPYNNLVRKLYANGTNPLALIHTAVVTKKELPAYIYSLGKSINQIGIPITDGYTRITSQSSTSSPATDFIAIGTADGDNFLSSASVSPGLSVVCISVPEEFIGADESTPYYENIVMNITKDLLSDKMICTIAEVDTRGILCAATRLTANGMTGIDIDFDAFLQINDNTSPESILKNKNQFLLLISVDFCNTEYVMKKLADAKIQAHIIGQTNDTGKIRIFENRRLIADIGIKSLTDGAKAESYTIEKVQPDWIKTKHQFDQIAVPEPQNLNPPLNYNETLLKMMSSPEIADKNLINSFFDTGIGIRTPVYTDSNIIISRIGYGKRAVVVSMVSEIEIVHFNARATGRTNAAEALRNCVCAGARPFAILCSSGISPETSPDKASASIDFIEGIKEICSEFNITISVVSSSNNYVCAISVINDIGRIVNSFFKNRCDSVFMIGETRDEIGHSKYLNTIHNLQTGIAPDINLKRERAVQEFIADAISKSLVESATSCMGGGIGVALAKSCTGNRAGTTMGAQITYDCGLRTDRLLFSETPSRVIVSVNSVSREEFLDLAHKHHVLTEEIGVTGGNVLKINDDIDIDLSTLREFFDSTINLTADTV